jgi:hypothetical protein
MIGSLLAASATAGCVDFRAHAEVAGIETPSPGPSGAPDASTGGADAASETSVADASSRVQDAAPAETPLADATSPPSDRPPEPPPAPAPSIDAAPADDAAGPTPGSVALLVVGSPATLTESDTRIRTLLASKGFTVRVADDNGPADVTGVVIAALSGSCASLTLGNKYRDVSVPVVVLDPAVLDNMAMTGSDAEDSGEETSTSVSIVMAGHPMAAGLTGDVAVVTAASNLGWGRPAAAAQRVATLQGEPARVAIFGYERGAALATGVAPAVRVGFFASDGSARYLSDNGIRLLAAAIDWAAR